MLWRGVSILLEANWNLQFICVPSFPPSMLAYARLGSNLALFARAGWKKVRMGGLSECVVQKDASLSAMI